jgi:hypothetical protein
MDQRRAARAELPPFKAVMKQKGAAIKYVDN